MSVDDHDATPEEASAVVRRLLLLMAELCAVSQGRTIRNASFQIANSSKFINIARRYFGQEEKVHQLLGDMEKVRARGLQDPASANDMIRLLLDFIDITDLKIYTLTLMPPRF